MSNSTASEALNEWVDDTRQFIRETATKEAEEIVTSEAVFRWPARDPNPSGIVPIEYRCLIQLDETETKTAGGIIIPDAVKDQKDVAQIQGTLVSVGALAFSTPDEGQWADAPKPGDRVIIAKYAGLEVEGKDGRKYRIANDKDVAAVMR